jgi:UDP-glucose/iron transport system ATP-binding protein
LLEAQEIGRRRDGGEGWLFRGLSLRLGAGERLAVAGPSGAGKTLLLRALALLDPLDEGEVRLRGAAPAAAEVPPFRRQVAYLHQRPALFEGSVEDNLRRPFALATQRGRRFDRERLAAWLGELGRDGGFLAKSTRDLSGGEAQITALLRLLQLAPSVLLLDEPTASLDADTAARAEALLGRWLADGPGERAWIWVSHDRGQAARLASRTLVLDGGRLQEGAP